MARPEGPQHRLSSLHELLTHPFRASPSPSAHLDWPPVHNTYHDRQVCLTPMNDVQSHHIDKSSQAEVNLPWAEPANLHQLLRTESLKELSSHFAPTTNPRLKPLIPTHLSYSLPSLPSLPPLSLPPLSSVPPVPSPLFPPVNSCASLPQIQSGSFINDNLIARGLDQQLSSSLEMEVAGVEFTYHDQSADQSIVPQESTSYDLSVGNECPTTVDEEPLNLSWGITKAGKARKRLPQACL